MDSYRSKCVGDGDRSRRPGRRDRARAYELAGPHARTRAGSPEQHPAGLQRPVRQHRVEGRRQDPPGHRRGDSRQGFRGQGVPERHEALRQTERPHRARQGATAGAVELLSDHTELFKQFSDNPSFKKWLSDSVFTLTYEEAD